MTISAGTDKDVYDGDGATDEWPITFSVIGLTSSDIAVYKTATTGISTLLTSNYTVDLDTPDVLYPIVGDKLTSEEQIVIVPVLEIEQESNYKNQGGVPPEILESDLDRLVRILKQLNEIISRSAQSDISKDEFDANALISAVQASATNSEASADLSAASAVSASASADDSSDYADLSAASAAAAAAIAGWEVASQAQAEAGTDNATVMTPLRVAQRSTAIISSQAQAEAGTDNATFMTPLRVKQAIDEFDSVLELASQGEAEAGTENTKAMTALRVAQAIAELESPGTVFISGTTYEIAGSSGEVNTGITSYAKKKEVAVAYGGTLRADWEMYQNDCGTVYARIYVNGAAVGAEKSTSACGWTAFYTEDIAVEPGDLVQLYIKVTGGAEGFARNFTLSSTVPEVSTVNL